MRTAGLVAIILGAMVVQSARGQIPPLTADDGYKAAFERAQKHFQDKHYDKAHDELLGLVGTGRENRWVGLARLTLAELYEIQGDEPALLRQLEIAAGAPAAPTGRDIMDTSDTRQEAIQKLGQYYLRKGEYKKAQESFTRWKPQSWCGTCADGMQARREYLLLICRLHLHEQSAVAQELLDAVRSESGLRPETAALLFRLYDEAKQTDDLVDLLSRSDNAKQDDGVQYLLHLQTLAKGKDVAGLIQLCEEHGKYLFTLDGNSLDAWKCRQASDVLLRCLDGDVTAVLKASKRQEGPGSWVIYIMGKSGLPRALEWLTERARADVSGHQIRFITSAIAWHGDAGKNALERLAREMTNHVAYWAGVQLATTPRPTPLDSPWQIPKSGSLPR